MKKLFITLLLIILIGSMLVSCVNPGKTDVTDTKTKETTIPTDTTNTIEPDPTIEYKKTIILDPGHGFSDPGTVIAITKGISDKSEADINISVVMALKSVLESRGYKVILTHDGKTFPSCEEIAKAADKYGIYYNEKDPKYWIPSDNRFDAYECGIWTQVLEKENDVDLFMSIHGDSSDSDKAYGTTIYYCCDTSCAYESSKYVSRVENAIKNIDRKVRSEGKSLNDAYIVTKYPKSPSMLIEVGFCSNASDMALMTDATWVNTFVSAIADGIDSYFGY